MYNFNCLVALSVKIIQNLECCLKDEKLNTHVVWAVSEEGLLILWGFMTA